MQSKVPEFLDKMLVNQYGEELAEKILQGYSSNRATTLRVNTIKSNKEEIIKVLNDNDISFKEVLWNNDALILGNATEQDIRKLLIYEEGKIYLQSLSSMIPPVVLSPNEKENILDMAAAPGGKTTQMAAISQNKAMITACEKNKIRVERLRFNIEKLGARVNVMVTDARNLDDFFSFDKVLLDAPCSGSGTIDLNRDDVEKTFTQELIERSQKTQIQMLTKALKVLKPGGEIVYSTCSILSIENEDVLNTVLQKFNAEIVPIEDNKYEEIPKLPTKIDGTMCVTPNELYEGFFVAKIRKK